MLTASNISKRYESRGGISILEDVSLSIDRGESMVVMGPSGSGKSTLVRLLAQERRPQAGSVVHRSGLTVGHLAQHGALDPARTPYEIVGSVSSDPETLELHAARGGNAQNSGEKGRSAARTSGPTELTLPALGLRPARLPDV